MAIESFLKVDKKDPDWSYSPSSYFGKQFKVIDANCLQIAPGTEDLMVLRLSPTENDMLCKHLQVIGRSNSRLDLYIICDGDVNLQQVFVYDVALEPYSILNIGFFVKNGKLNKHIVEAELAEGSVLNIFGLVENDIGGSSEVINKICHSEPSAESQQLINCKAGKNSRTVFQGYVRVIEGMTDNFVTVANSSIITEEGGQAYSVPQMMIDCGEVEASHSCAVGKFDEEAIWYLQSRGMSEEGAKELLIRTHQDYILNMIPHQEIQDELKEFFQN